MSDSPSAGVEERLEGTPNVRITTLRVDGMDCAEDVRAIEGALEKMSGVEQILCDLTSGKVRVRHASQTVDSEAVR